MVSEKREPAAPPPDAANLPYLADLSALLPSSNKQVRISFHLRIFNANLDSPGLH
jgi:hypothetical protein